jgi:two-component system, chemotaxis family, protein-glutamate methylesterase/glutaminase
LKPGAVESCTVQQSRTVLADGFRPRVVRVGGSAGGLDAYTRLLQRLPVDMGVAIVIVNHVRTVPTTLLHEILPYYTNMPVELITERLRLQPNHVFIIPPKHDLHVLDGEFSV